MFGKLFSFLNKTAFPGVMVGQVRSVIRHPNADRLLVTEVDIGDSAHLLTIVCGASNFNEGDKVAVATIGAKLPNGAEIKLSEIRGQKSSGMLCAEDELGLGDDHSGIKILPANAKLGDKIDKYV